MAAATAARAKAEADAAAVVAAAADARTKLEADAAALVQQASEAQAKAEAGEAAAVARAEAAEAAAAEAAVAAEAAAAEAAAAAAVVAEAAVAEAAAAAAAAAVVVVAPLVSPSAPTQPRRDTFSSSPRHAGNRPPPRKQSTCAHSSHTWIRARCQQHNSLPHPVPGVGPRGDSKVKTRVALWESPGGTEECAPTTSHSSAEDGGAAGETPEEYEARKAETIREMQGRKAAAAGLAAATAAENKAEDEALVANLRAEQAEDVLVAGLLEEHAALMADLSAQVGQATAADGSSGSDLGESTAAIRSIHRMF